MVAIPVAATTVADEDAHGSLKSLQKGLAVLEIVAAADVPPKLAEVAALAGISRPSAYRVIQTLIQDGYVIQDPQSGRLSIGFSVLMLSSTLLDRNKLRLESLPHLQSLSNLTGERTNAGILHRNKVLYLAGVEKPSLPTIYSRFGKTAPAHCCSLGKAMLAHLPEPDVKTFLSVEPLIAQTPNSITQVDKLLEELETTRRRGYATDVREHMVNSCCIAAPIFDGQDRPVGAIGISGKEIEPIMVHVPALLQTAELISHGLQRS